MYGQADLHNDSQISQNDGYIVLNYDNVNNDKYKWRTTSGSRMAPPSLMLRKELRDFIGGKSSKSDAVTNFVLALESNNLTQGWSPAHPMVVFHSVYDEVVPLINYEKAKNAFSAAGMFHGVVYNTRMMQKHNDVAQMFYAFYLANYAYSILNSKVYALETETTIEGMY